MSDTTNSKNFLFIVYIISADFTPIIKFLTHFHLVTLHALDVPNTDDGPVGILWLIWSCRSTPTSLTLSWDSNGVSHLWNAQFARHVTYFKRFELCLRRLWNNEFVTFLFWRLSRAQRSNFPFNCSERYCAQRVEAWSEIYFNILLALFGLRLGVTHPTRKSLRGVCDVCQVNSTQKKLSIKNLRCDVLEFC